MKVIFYTFYFSFLLSLLLICFMVLKLKYEKDCADYVIHSYQDHIRIYEHEVSKTIGYILKKSLKREGGQ